MKKPVNTPENLLFLLILTPLILLACSMLLADPDPRAEPAQDAAITGLNENKSVPANEARIVTAIVVDRQTSQLVPQAIIEVFDEPASRFEIMPQAGQDAGSFEITLMTDPGQIEPVLQLKAMAPGYVAGTFSLPMSQQAVQLMLEPTMIEGQVLDAWTADPLPVTLQLSHNRLSTTRTESLETGRDGRFQALRLESPLTLRIDEPGYEPWQMQFDSPEQLIEATAAALQIELQPRTTTGVLRAANTNKPLAGVSLSAGLDNRRQAVTTDAAGSFEFHRLQSADPIVVQAPAGYLSVDLTYAGEPELTVTLQPDRLIVQVQDSFSGQPATGVELMIAETITATTDTRGQATFTSAPAAGQITLAEPGYRPVTIDYQNPGTVEMSLTPTALAGVVRDAQTGQPLPQTGLYLGDVYLRANEAGRFVIENLPEVETPLLVKASGYHRAFAQLSQAGIVTGTTSIPFNAAEGRPLLTAPCTEPSGQSGSPCLEVLLSPFEVKAIYIPFQYLRSRELMHGYLDFIQATELNAFVVDVKGDFGLIAWDSDLALAAEVGAETGRSEAWMPLDELIAEAKKRQIYSIARLVVFKDDPLAHGKPELAAVREDGTVWIDGEELGWANPFKEAVWDYNIALAKEVAEFGFDELNFDYIRFPSDGNIGAIAYQEESTRETRTTAIREFIRRLTEGLRPYGVFTSADVFGLTLWVTPESDMNIGQRVIDIAPQIDYLAPMVYPSTFIPGNLGYDNPSAEPYGIIFRSQQKAEELVPPYVKVRPWLQGYWYSLEEMRLLKQAAGDAQSTGWAWWNAGGRYDEALFGPAGSE
jgi:hypothetical protein